MFFYIADQSTGGSENTIDNKNLFYFSTTRGLSSRAGYSTQIL